MRRILSIAIRDFKSSLRDFIAIYIIVSPILLAFLIAGFVPSAESATVTIAVDDTVSSEIIESLENYVDIDRYKSREDLEERINSLDDILGLVQNDQSFEVIKEGNELDDSEELIINLLIKEKSVRAGELIHKVDVKFSSIGVETSPIAILGLISMVIIALVLGGMIVSMNIIEEKENMTFAALNSTPLTRFEFITGKSLAGSIIAVIQIIIMFFIFGFSEVDYLKVLFISIMGLSVVIIMGFILGLVSPNQMAAVANMKILFLPISITIVGAVLIPTSKHFVLWWSPFYWIYDGVTEIINETATWSGLIIDGIAIIFITCIIYYIFKNKINSNLAKS